MPASPASVGSAAASLAATAASVLQDGTVWGGQGVVPPSTSLSAQAAQPAPQQDLESVDDTDVVSDVAGSGPDEAAIWENTVLLGGPSPSNDSTQTHGTLQVTGPGVMSLIWAEDRIPMTIPPETFAFVRTVDFPNGAHPFDLAMHLQSLCPHLRSVSTPHIDVLITNDNGAASYRVIVKSAPKDDCWPWIFPTIPEYWPVPPWTLTVGSEDAPIRAESFATWSHPEVAIWKVRTLHIQLLYYKGSSPNAQYDVDALSLNALRPDRYGVGIAEYPSMKRDKLLGQLWAVDGKLFEMVDTLRIDFGPIKFTGFARDLPVFFKRHRERFGAGGTFTMTFWVTIAQLAKEADYPGRRDARKVSHGHPGFFVQHFRIDIIGSKHSPGAPRMKLSLQPDGPLDSGYLVPCSCDIPAVNFAVKQVEHALRSTGCGIFTFEMQRPEGDAEATRDLYASHLQASRGMMGLRSAIIFAKKNAHAKQAPTWRHQARQVVEMRQADLRSIRGRNRSREGQVGAVYMTTAVNLSTPPPFSAAVGGTYESPAAPSKPSQGGFDGTLAPQGDTWLAPRASSPPSPSTVDSTTDTGNEFPPDLTDITGRARSTSQPSFKRNLSLNLSLPSTFPTSNPSPASFTGYDFSGEQFNPEFLGQDYFQFGNSTPAEETTEQFNGQFGYRLPASQPSSPVRSIYPPGQAPYIAAGRQRGATFSGTYSPLTDQFNQVASAIPPHLSFTQIRGQSLQASPVIGTEEVLMEDLTQSVPAVPIIAPPSRRPSVEVSMTGEMIDKLTLIDKIMNSAQEAKNAILRGEDIQVSANLGQISNQLDVASGLGVGPTHTPREQTPATASVSPVQYQTSPVVAVPVISPTANTSMQSQIPIRPNVQPMNPPLAQSVQMQAAHTMPAVPSMQTQPMYQSMQMQMPAPPMQAAAQMQTPQLQQTPQMQQTPQLQQIPSQPPQQLQHMQPQHMSNQQAMGQMPQQMPQMMSSQQMPAQQMPPIQGGQMPMQMGLLPPLPVDLGMRSEPASAGPYMSHNMMPPAPPPLVHSHSYPNGHALPSQAHAPQGAPQGSFAQTIGIGHAPHTSSPLATMPVSRPPSPKPIPAPLQLPDAVQRTVSDSNTLATPRRPSLSDNRSISESRADGLPIARGRSSSINKAPRGGVAGMTTSVPPSAWQSRATSPEDDDDSEDEGPRRSKRRRSSAGEKDPALSVGAMISEDMRRQLDRIFEEFLQKVCSDLDMVDQKGEKIHQVLMPKKMAKLDESPDYRPFKFRIQAFTNKFQQELTDRGITEETMSLKKVKAYLWKQDLISRFNADGKKAKSKGNHIWNVDAKKLPSGGWVFRPFKRRIIGQPAAFALINKPYEWEPRIWDPQAPSEQIKPRFFSPPNSLPAWLSWDENGKLVGTPTQQAGPVTVIAKAEFIDGASQSCTLETSFTITVVVPALMPVESVYSQPYWGMEEMPMMPMAYAQPVPPPIMYQPVYYPEVRQ